LEHATLGFLIGASLGLIIGSLMAEYRSIEIMSLGQFIALALGPIKDAARDFSRAQNAAGQTLSLSSRNFVPPTTTSFSMPAPSPTGSGLPTAQAIRVVFTNARIACSG
jgi:hypothetical protein